MGGVKQTSKIETISCHLVDFEKLPPDPVIIDAGACVGAFTYEVKRKLGGRGKFYCIECDKRNFATLAETKVPGVSIHYSALVGDDREKVSCYAYDGMDRREWSNIFDLYSVHQSIRNVRVLDDNVPTITIEKIMKEYLLNRIDYLKMDVEGTEFDVLMNMPTSILTSIPQISFEYHKLSFRELEPGAKRNKDEYRELDDNFYKLKSHLEDNGFKVSLCTHNEVYCVRSSN
jgi:FkbM family methyltransferase